MFTLQGKDEEEAKAKSSWDELVKRLPLKIKKKSYSEVVGRSQL